MGRGICVQDAGSQGAGGGGGWVGGGWQKADQPRVQGRKIRYLGVGVGGPKRETRGATGDPGVRDRGLQKPGTARAE
jgi:hypothetical protein